MPDDADKFYGKMRAQSNTHGKNHYYRCRARDFGRDCTQSSVYANVVEEQVIQALKTLKPPEDWCKRIVEVMGSLLGDKRLEERISETKAVIERMDVGMSLRPNYHVTLGLESEKPTEIEMSFTEDIIDGDIIIRERGATGFVAYCV